MNNINDIRYYNEMLADFLGWHKNVDGEFIIPEDCSHLDITSYVNGYAPKLRFHESLDWLIVVIENLDEDVIEIIPGGINFYHVRRDLPGFPVEEYYYPVNYNENENRLGILLTKVTYEAVIDAIKIKQNLK